jgi:hypothetical protein
MRYTLSLSALPLLLMMAGCKPAPSPTKDTGLGSQIPEKADVDPAVARALEDPIMVDPALVGQANQGALLPHDPPSTGAVPIDPNVPHAAGERPEGPDLGERAQTQLRGCADGLTYDLTWSARLPDDVPMASGSQVEEAAGKESPRCHVRAVTFTNAATPDDVLAFYRTALHGAGYGVTVHRAGRDISIKAMRGGGAAAFVLITPGQKQGSIIDLITNTGR